MQDWEILTLSLFITFVAMTAITWWVKPETDKYVWAREELREREILKVKEYVQNEEEKSEEKKRTKERKKVGKLEVFFQEVLFLNP